MNLQSICVCKVEFQFQLFFKWLNISLMPHKVGFWENIHFYTKIPLSC